jgi:hypothetical protein
MDDRPMELHPETRVRRTADVLDCRLDGESVLLDAGSGTYFGLDPVGSRCWELLGEGKTLGEVHQALAAEYEVDRSTLWGDLCELVAELEEHRLVEPDVPRPAAVPSLPGGPEAGG